MGKIVFFGAIILGGLLVAVQSANALCNGKQGLTGRCLDMNLSHCWNSDCTARCDLARANGKVKVIIHRPKTMKKQS